MGRIGDFAKSLTRKKTLTADMLKSDLLKCLSLADLTFLSIGSMVGSGLYVLTGTVTKYVAGPSVVLSYLIAAIASGFSAICYAEFGARIPVTGSAYQFTYISVGEIWAFIIGWNVLLEHAISATAVARSCSSYIDALFGHPIKNYMLIHAPMAGGEILAAYPDFVAVGILLVFTVVLAFGVHTSSKVNMVLAALNLLIIVFIFVTGMYLGNIKNWTDVKGGYFPYGFDGTIAGASTLIFSYVGYEVIASSTEESIRPKRDVPLSLVISLGIVVVCYCSASAALTFMVPYDKLSAASPFPDAYSQHGWTWARYVISIGAVAAMATSLLNAMFVVPRYLYAMGRDGLLLKVFTRVNGKTKVPVISVVTCGLFCVACVFLFNLHALIEFIAIGQLLACTFVSLCVVILRYQPNNITRYMELYEAQSGLEFPPGRNATEETKLSGDNLRSDDKAGLTDNDYGSIEAEGDSGMAHSSISGPNPLESPKNGSITTVATAVKVVKSDNRVGQVKLHLLNGRYGFLFTPMTKYKPGRVVELSLIFSSAWVFLIAIFSLFLRGYASQWWWILVIIISSLMIVLGILVIIAHEQDTSLKTFKVPLTPYVPFISIGINIFLMLKLKPMTWVRLAVWMAVGMAIYFGYGYRHSSERKTK